MRRPILELRLQRLNQPASRKVTDELEELAPSIKDYLDILSSRERILAMSRPETPRGTRQTLCRAAPAPEIHTTGRRHGGEDLIRGARHGRHPVTQGRLYQAQTPLAEFRAQKRGGKGLAGGDLKEEDVVTTLFVANTHTQLLFFTTDGMVYKLKTWRLPQSARTSRGKAIVNILPIPQGVSIAAIMPVDRDEEEWADLNIVFATSAGDVRRNRLSDFTNVMRNGKIAMKLPEDGSVSLIGARICSEDDDMMLVTARGRAIRFHIGGVDSAGSPTMRVFNSRNSTGVRGIRLQDGDRVVSMSVIRHFEATPEEREAYLKMRRAQMGAPDDGERDEDEAPVEAGQLPLDRFAEMSAAENLILTITARGQGKLSSSHDYPVRGRGGQGVTAMDKAQRGGPVVSSFPVEIDDQIMLVTNMGQSIRVPVDGISFRSRSAGGVKVFDTRPGEEVASVAWIADQGEGEEPEAEG